MGKLTTYILVMSGLMLLFYFSGLLDSTANSTILNLLLNPESIKTSELDVQVILVLEGLLVGGIVVGFAAAGNVELGVMGIFAIFMMNMLWDFLRVFSKVYSINPVMALLLFSPILLLYAVTIIEWWRGAD